MNNCKKTPEEFEQNLPEFALARLPYNKEMNVEKIMKQLFLLITAVTFVLAHAKDRAHYEAGRGCVGSNGASSQNSMDSGYCDDCHDFECCAGHEDISKTEKLFKACNKTLSDYQMPRAGQLINAKGASFSTKDGTHKVNLTGVHLNGANLEGANFSHVDLSGANLRGSNLAQANLSDVNLTQSHLDYANLFEAKLNGVNFKNAYMDQTVMILTQEQNSPLDDRHHRHVLRDAASLCLRGQQVLKRKSEVRADDYGERQAIAALEAGLDQAFADYNEKFGKNARPGNAECEQLINKQKRGQLIKQMNDLWAEMKEEVERETSGHYTIDPTKMASTIFSVVSGTYPLIGVILPLFGPTEKVKSQLSENARQRHEQRLQQIIERYEKKREVLRQKLNLIPGGVEEINDEARRYERTRGGSEEETPTPVPASGTQEK